MARKSKTRRREQTRSVSPSLPRRTVETTSNQRSQAQPVAKRQTVAVISRPVQRVVRKTSLSAPSPFRDVQISIRPSVRPGRAVSQRLAPKMLPTTRKVQPKRTPTKPARVSALPSPFEPDRSAQSSDKARENATCKERPDSTKAAKSKGGGGAKKFIPWCEVRR